VGSEMCIRDRRDEEKKDIDSMQLGKEEPQIKLGLSGRKKPTKLSIGGFTESANQS